MLNCLRVIQVASFVALGSVALSGCTSSFDAVDTPAPTASTTVTTPNASSTPTPTPALTPAPSSGDMDGVAGCSTLSKIVMPNLAEGQTMVEVAWNGVEPVDKGQSEGARGIITKTADGRIESYTVTDGDSPLAIGSGCASQYSHTCITTT